jgi:hypothetical protein
VRSEKVSSGEGQLQQSSEGSALLQQSSENSAENYEQAQGTFVQTQSTEPTGPLLPTSYNDKKILSLEPR